MKKLIKEAKRLQQLAGLIKEGMGEKTVSFGPFKNVEYYLRPEEDKIFLTVTESDNFREFESSIEYTSDELTDEQIDLLNNKVEDLAQEMSSYLTSNGIENEIFDNPIGYGQEIDNLVVAINNEDLAKLM
jgi:hypothetical protein